MAQAGYHQPIANGCVNSLAISARESEGNCQQICDSIDFLCIIIIIYCILQGNCCNILNILLFVMNLLLMQSVSVAVSIPNGWMSYIQLLIHRIELRYYAYTVLV